MLDDGDPENDHGHVTSESTSGKENTVQHQAQSDARVEQQQPAAEEQEQQQQQAMQPIDHFEKELDEQQRYLLLILAYKFRCYILFFYI